MGTVTLEQVGGEELAAATHSGGTGRAGRLGKGRAARRAARAGGCRDRRAEGQAHPGADRGPAGHEVGEVTLGGRRVAVDRPRVRSADGHSEVRLRTYEYFGDRDPLSRAVLERMLAGVATRRYRRTQEPVGQEVEQQARSTSRSSVSRTFIERTRRSLSELMSRRLDDVRLAVMMIERRPLSSSLPDITPDRRHQTERTGDGKGHRDELGDA